MNIETIKKYLTDPKVRFSINQELGLYNRMPDEKFLKKKFKLYIGYDLNLDNPKSFNEKLQWLKLHDRQSIYTTMVDKYEVKSYIASIIGDEHIIPTLGVWNSFDEIDFDTLPNQFVLKCTNDSGGVVICKNKSDLDKMTAKQKIEKCLNSNFYYWGREWPYKNVEPRIIAEAYMEDSSGEDLNDYKLMCFNGKVKCSFVCSERYSDEGLKVTFFDNDWSVLPFERHYPKSTRPIDKPENFNEMIQLAEKLSKDIPFVRVDFYDINGKIYFGEMTFFPGCGFEEFTPEEWDYKLGEWIDLSWVKKK